MLKVLYSICLMSLEMNCFMYLPGVYIFTTEDIPHTIFKRDNMNLIMVKKVSLKQALCGIQINIKTLDHKFLRVNITQVIT